jgi:signal transduction histidine kinase
VSRRAFPGGLRLELALAIAVVTLVGVGASFFVLYSVTGARLRSQIDSQLRTQVREWQQFAAGRDLSSPAALRQAAERFIAGQRYHAQSLVTVVSERGGPVVSSEPELTSLEREREGDTGGLLGSPIGLSTQSVPEAGGMRVLAVPIDSGSRRLGVLRVGSPLTPVIDAQSSMRRAFVVVGVSALVLAVLAGIGLAALIAAPLRRITAVAAALNTGDLSRRAGTVGGAGEMRTLAAAFDGMLDRLERAFERQRDFVTDASHELRTPLAVLRAQVELLDREVDERARHEATVTLLRRLDELDRLVGDMLTLAGAEAGGLVEARPIELAGFFEDIRRDLPLFGERDFHMRAVGGTLQADPDRLTQVLRNLVRNAVAHTQPSDRIDVTARADGDRLEIAVADTGPGIAPDQLELIFERFHRVDPARSLDRGGAGLGLAIARAIVEAHGGWIRAESTPDGGACFRLELPGYRPVSEL